MRIRTFAFCVFTANYDVFRSANILNVRLETFSNFATVYIMYIGLMDMLFELGYVK